MDNEKDKTKRTSQTQGGEEDETNEHRVWYCTDPGSKKGHNWDKLARC